MRRPDGHDIRVTFIDLTKAYDRVMREDIWRCTKERNLPEKHVKPGVHTRVYDPTELSRANRVPTVQRSLSGLHFPLCRDTIQLLMQPPGVFFR